MKQELQKIAILGSVILLSIFIELTRKQNVLIALQWFLQAGLIWGFVCQFTWWQLSLNRANEHAPLYHALGLGNRLTILRGGLIAVTGGFLFLPHEVWFAALPYSLSVILDRVDGFVARRYKQTSLLGTQLDITFDALGLMIAPLMAISSGQIHWSYFLLSIAYYIYQAGLHYRKKQALPIYSSPENSLRRTLAGFQMGLITLVLWSIFTPSFTIIASIAFMLPVLFGFGVDWFINTGKVNAQIIMTLAHISDQIFQPILRVIVVLSLFLFLKTNLTPHFIWLGLMLSMMTILLGVAGRVGALFILITLGLIDIQINALTSTIIISASWILMLGTGQLSLWKFGDEWVKRYDGA
ncbi:MAG: hypothetical protein RLZZ66_685 [Pseudomonadota bacterium]|jgi:CDP-diacylglycerol--glycerol-3-phosphate 3-phosphatidyltransferase